MSDDENFDQEEYVKALIQRASSFVSKPKKQVEPNPQPIQVEEEPKKQTKRFQTESQLEKMRENLARARLKAQEAKEAKKASKPKDEEPKKVLRKYNEPEPYKPSQPSKPSEPVKAPVKATPPPPSAPIPIPKPQYFIPTMKHYMKVNNGLF